MPVPIRPIADQKNNVNMDYSFLFNNPPPTKKTVTASNKDASVLYEIWDKGEKIEEDKFRINLSDKITHGDIARLKGLGFLASSNEINQVKFTKKGKIVITTMALGEVNQFEKRREPKKYTEILASMNKKGKKGFRIAQAQPAQPAQPVQQPAPQAQPVAQQPQQPVAQQQAQPAAQPVYLELIDVRSKKGQQQANDLLQKQNQFMAGDIIQSPMYTGKDKTFRVEGINPDGTLNVMALESQRPMQTPLYMTDKRGKTVNQWTKIPNAPAQQPNAQPVAQQPQPTQQPQQPVTQQQPQQPVTASTGPKFAVNTSNNLNLGTAWKPTQK